MTDFLSIALHEASEGRRVFPCNGKIPVTKNGVLDATNDEAKIQEWAKQYPDANVGIAFTKDSREVGLDLDADLLPAWQEKGYPPIKTRKVQTGGGGFHFYLLRPDGVFIPNIPKSKGFELKSDNQYLMAPGSIHPETGKVYELVDDSPPAPMPEWLIELCLNGSKPATARKQGTAIKESTRNATLTSIGGAMRRQGADQAAIEVALLEANQAQCQPPLSETEVLNIAKSISKYEPQPDTTRLTLTDTGNAERLVNLHGEKLRYNYERNLWLVFTGKRWEWDSGSLIVKLAKETARSIYNEAAFEIDDKKRDDLAKHAKSSESNQRIKGMIELARAELAVNIEDLNTDQYLLNVNNGTIDLRSGELQPYDPADLITYLIPLDYEPGVTSKTWHDFLYRIFEDNERLILYVQKSLGYSITGCQDEQALWFNHGPGSNGKTTLMGVVIDVLGDYAIEIDPLAFVVDKNARTGPNEALASLYNRRFAAATEVKTGMTLDVALIKRMTGGEMIRCERKFEHGFNFKPTHKLWLSGNHEPRITDTTNSIWNRLKYIPFKATIEDNERIKGLRNLISRKHGQAILSWLVEGCLLWQSEGLGEPPEVKEAIQAYRDSQDILHDFITEGCLIQKGETISVADLYKEYKSWAEDNDIKPVGKNNFGNRLKEKGFETQRGNANQLFWYGIRLLTPEEKVTLVTFVTKNLESSQENISRIETFKKNGNKDNKSNTFNNDELPDCPECGFNEWVMEADGSLTCPCGYQSKGGE